MVDPDELLKCFSWQYQGWPKAAYAAAILSTPAENQEDDDAIIVSAISRLRGVFTRTFKKGRAQEILPADWKPWLLPTSLKLDAIPRRRMAVEVELRLAERGGAEPPPFDFGCYLVAVLDLYKRPTGFVLLQDGSWAGPIDITPLPVSDDIARFLRYADPIDFDFNGSVALTDTSVEIQVVGQEAGYDLGPYGVYIEYSQEGYSTFEEFVEQDDRFKDDREEAWREAVREHPGSDDNASVQERRYEYYREYLLNLNGFDDKLPGIDVAEIVLHMGEWIGAVDIERTEAFATLSADRQTWTIQTRDGSKTVHLPATGAADPDLVVSVDENTDRGLPSAVRLEAMKQGIPLPIGRSMEFQAAIFTSEKVVVLPEKFWDVEHAEHHAERWIAANAPRGARYDIVSRFTGAEDELEETDD